MLQLKTLVLKLLVDQSSNSYRAIFTLGHLLTSSYTLLEDIISGTIRNHIIGNLNSRHNTCGPVAVWISNSVA